MSVSIPQNFFRLFGVWIFRVFLFCFSLLFFYQQIVDNDSICGDIGKIENTCPYNLDFSGSAESDSAESEHICTNCPCNAFIQVHWNLFLSQIYISGFNLFMISENFTAHPIALLFLILRPPKN